MENNTPLYPKMNKKILFMMIISFSLLLICCTDEKKSREVYGFKTDTSHPCRAVP